MRVPRGVADRVKTLEDILNQDDDHIDLAELLDKTPDEITAWLENFERSNAEKIGPEALRQCELMIETRRQHIADMHERARALS